MKENVVTGYLDTDIYCKLARTRRVKDEETYIFDFFKYTRVKGWGAAFISPHSSAPSISSPTRYLTTSMVVSALDVSA